MKVQITHLKAPWPHGGKVGDIVEVGSGQVGIPAWALGKCQPMPDDAKVTVEIAAAEPAVEAEPAATGDDLRAQAEALGIKVDGRWSEQRLAEEIEKAKAAK